MLCYSGENAELTKLKFRPVTNESKIKNVLVLKVPTYCSPFMMAVYQNQVGTLNSIRESDEAEEHNMAVVCESSRGMCVH